MSSPSSVQSCPEPFAYSNDSYSAAEVEQDSSSSLETSLIDSKVISSRFAEIDSILSNQLGGVTVPGAELPPSFSQPSSLSEFPILPIVNESSATPVLSSNMGADINSSYTLLQNPSTLPTNQLSSDIAPTASIPLTASTELPNLVSSLISPTSTITTSPITVSNEGSPSAPVDFIQSNEVVPLAQTESYNNINKSNIAKFIQKNQPNKKEHFNGSSNRKKEHFGISSGSSIIDTLLLCVIIGGTIYYIVSPSNSAGLVNSVEDTISKVPVISQLIDPKVSDTNKLLIVAAVVLAFIFISNMLS
jgi:hypothetical protein